MMIDEKKTMCAMLIITLSMLAGCGSASNEEGSTAALGSSQTQTATESTTQTEIITSVTETTAVQKDDFAELFVRELLANEDQWKPYKEKPEEQMYYLRSTADDQGKNSEYDYYCAQCEIGFIDLDLDGNCELVLRGEPLNQFTFKNYQVYSFENGTIRKRNELLMLGDGLGNKEDLYLCEETSANKKLYLVNQFIPRDDFVSEQIISELLLENDLKTAEKVHHIRTYNTEGYSDSELAQMGVPTGQALNEVNAECADFLSGYQEVSYHCLYISASDYDALSEQEKFERLTESYHSFEIGDTKGTPPFSDYCEDMAPVSEDDKGDEQTADMQTGTDEKSYEFLSGKDYSFTGTVQSFTGYDAHNQPEYRFELILDQPITFWSEMYNKEFTCESLQLAGEDGSFERYAGQHTKITGQLFEAHTAHHHRDGLISVNGIELS